MSHAALQPRVLGSFPRLWNNVQNLNFFSMSDSMAKVYVVTADVVIPVAPNHRLTDRQLVGVSGSLYEAKRLAWAYQGLLDASEVDASGLPFFAVHECEWGEITAGAVQTFNPKAAPLATKITFEQFRHMWRWWNEQP